MSISFPFPVWYIFGYGGEYADSAYRRLLKSISSIPKDIEVNIIDVYGYLHNLHTACRDHNINIHTPDKDKKSSRPFCKSYFYNHILSSCSNHDYFFFSDVDLVYPVTFFDYVFSLLARLDFHRNDIRLIMTNSNIAPLCKIPSLPLKSYPRLSAHFPDLFNWDISASSFEELQLYPKYPSNYAHGCGVFPTRPLQYIGGFNTEIYGHGPEDAIMNRRLSYYSRVIYHTGNSLCQTLHLPHRPLNQENKAKNACYWQYYCQQSSLHGAHSDLILKQSLKRTNT